MGRRMGHLQASARFGAVAANFAAGRVCRGGFGANFRGMSVYFASVVLACSGDELTIAGGFLAQCVFIKR